MEIYVEKAPTSAEVLRLAGLDRFGNNGFWKITRSNKSYGISSAGKQEGKRKLEKFTDLASEDSDFPLLLMTAEEYIFADFSDSIRTKDVRNRSSKPRGESGVNGIERLFTG